MVQGGLGARFPECLEEIMLGRVRENLDEAKRDTAIIRVVLKKLITAVKGLHSLGEQSCKTRYQIHLSTCGSSWVD